MNGQKVDQCVLRDGDQLELGKDRVSITFFSGPGKIKFKPAFDTTQIFQKSLTDIGRLLPSDLSDLEKISCLLDFQYQWGQSYTSDAAFFQILQSALKISAAERAFVLVRKGENFEYAAGLDGRASRRSFRKRRAG